MKSYLLKRSAYIFKMMVSMLLGLSLIICLTGCVKISAVSREREFEFTAVVSEIESDGGVLFNTINNDVIAGPIIVYPGNEPDIRVGDIVTVYYDGIVAKSYPGKIFNAKIVPQK